MKLISYCISLVLFAAWDGLWLFITGKSLYAKHLGHLIKTTPSWLPAILFYLIFIAGVIFFVISPAIEKNASMASTFLTGAFFGLVTYATYDLTNQAFLKNWPVFITIIDIAWGSFITGTVSCITVMLLRLIK